MVFTPPVELAMVITEWASLDPYRGGTFHTDNSTLLSLSLVSRLWSGHARKLLFRKVRIRSTADELVYKGAYDAFVQRVHIARKFTPTVVEQIRALSLGCQCAYFGTTLDLSAIAALVALLPNLHALHLTLLSAHLEIPDLFSFDDLQLSLIRSARCAKSLTHISMRSQISDPVILHQLLTTFPNVHTLTLEAPRHSTVYAAPPALSNLKTLILDNAGISRKCLAYLGKCQLRLAALSLCTTADLLKVVNGLDGSMLEDLCVLDADINFDPELTFAHLAEWFPKLRRFVLGFAVDKEVLSWIPRGVRCFGFDPHVELHIGDEAPEDPEDDQHECTPTPFIDIVLEWLEARPFIRTIATLYSDGFQYECETEQVERVRKYCKDNARRWCEVYRMCADVHSQFTNEVDGDEIVDDDATPRASVRALPDVG